MKKSVRYMPDWKAIIFCSKKKKTYYKVCFSITTEPIWPKLGKKVENVLE